MAIVRSHDRFSGGSIAPGLFIVKRFLLPHIRLHDGVNDAVSGTVQSIGVFYAVTVGLIAVGVWNTYSNTQDLVSKEAAAIGSIYRDVSGYAEPPRTELQAMLREYTVQIIEKAWPAHKQGQISDERTRILDRFQATLLAYEPASEGQKALHAETLRAFNNLIEFRRLRLDQVGGGLSGIMWFVIWIGAAISISVGYFYKIEDPKLHTVLVGLTAAFLGIVLFMIMINDRPFAGDGGVSPASYQLILDKLIDLPR
jgi:Protein of unknown function (DUF4239)